ncbi:MAG: hypothetical protein DRH57_01350 [Candidatus Cloacimonadota bacterium]|nr:MAG: hypothetical protein DRH57_01350 [Candidatus Cloacimonadota bacterium]
MKRLLVIITILWLLIYFTVTFAGTTGKLVGRVIDADTKEPIANASVILLGTEMGGPTDNKGRYMIINIPPGTYDVKSLQMGYAPMTVKGVKISLDLTTTINFELHKEAIGVKGIEVKAKKKLVDKDITGSVNIVSTEDVKAMPIENIQEVVALEAGAVGSGESMHIRGGRSGEVVYTVDGMSVSNPVYGGFGLNLDMDAVKDMSIQTGGFTAEFGNAQSAIINLVTKSGGPEYSGKIEYRTDHLIGEGNNSDQVKFNFGGPVLFGKMKDKFTFFINASGSWTDTRYKDYYHIDKDDAMYSYLSKVQIDEINSLGSGRDKFLGIELGDRFLNNYQFRFKTKYKIDPKRKIYFSYTGDKETYRPYSHSWRYALEHYQHQETTHNRQSFTFDHSINPKMFYTIKGSRFVTNVKIDPGVDRDWYFTGSTKINEVPLKVVGDQQVQNPEYPTRGWTLNFVYYDELGNPENASFIAPGTYDGTNLDDKTTTYNLRSDFTYQINEVHSAKTGFEFMYHNIEKDVLGSPWYIYESRRQEYLGKVEPVRIDTLEEDGTITIYEVYSHEDSLAAIKYSAGKLDGYKAKPWQGAFYVQDKMEWEGMIVNMGIRFDVWYLKDWLFGKEYEILKSDGTYEVKKFAKNLQIMVSPRLGVSHPITEKDVLHFAYNYQSQLPAMQYVFTSATPEVGESGSLVGNPNLKPETTITYEVGIGHQIGEDYLIDITTYYKNIYNLVSTELVRSKIEAAREYNQYVSKDYGSVKGIDFSFSKRFSNFWGLKLNYSYSWAMGTNSGAHDVVNSEIRNLREFPLSWDVRHNANVNCEFNIPKDEEFRLFGLKLPDQLGFTFLWRINSGLPYTPITEYDKVLDTNSERMPWTSTANLKFTKKFDLIKKSKVELYCQINNLFDKRNVRSIYPKTGTPLDEVKIDEYLKEAELEAHMHGTEIDQNYYKIWKELVPGNPGIRSSGRRIEFGFVYRW